MGLIFLLALLVALLVWLVIRRGGYAQPQDPDLDEAEEEVRGLSTFSTPEDAEDQLPDWGPGTPRG